MEVVSYAIANTRFQGSNYPETLKELDADTNGMVTTYTSKHYFRAVDEQVEVSDFVVAEKNKKDH